MLRNIPSAISTYLPTANNKTGPARGRHNHYTVFGFGLVTTVSVRSILFHMMPTAGRSDFLKDKYDIPRKIGDNWDNTPNQLRAGSFVYVPVIKSSVSMDQLNQFARKNI
jgi:hypothetical protein